jgi:phosphohistidine phosphatase
MHLFLIRHAHAVAATEDSERPLSSRGRKQIRRLARFLKQTDMLSVSEIWHSPLVRSRETAKLIIEKLAMKARLKQADGIEGDDAPGIIANRVKTRRADTAIVGHEPHLSALASLLITGAAEPPQFVLKKSAVVAFELSEDSWAVRWHVSPEIIP